MIKIFQPANIFVFTKLLWVLHTSYFFNFLWFLVDLLQLYSVILKSFQHTK